MASRKSTCITLSYLRTDCRIAAKTRPTQPDFTAAAGNDYNLWLIGKDRWLVCGHPDRDAVFKWNVMFDAPANFVRQAPTGAHVICHIHPVYVSQN